MGSSFSGLKNVHANAFRPFAFPAPPPTYGEDLAGLEFVQGDVYRVPIVWNNPKRVKGKTIIFSHGNGCDIGSSDVVFKALEDITVNILMYDYPGYGLCKGLTSQESCYDVILDVYNHVRNTGVDVNDIILMGQSIGTGPTVWLAKELQNDNLSAVVLISPYTSAMGVVSPAAAAVTRTSVYIVGDSMDIFDSYRNIQSVSCPVKIIHGTEDRVINFSHAQELQSVANLQMPLAAIEGAGHNDLWYTHSARITREILMVLRHSRNLRFIWKE